MAKGQAGAGKLVVTYPAMGRQLTFRDLLHLMQALMCYEGNDGAEIEYTEDGWLIEIVDLPFALNLPLLSELPMEGTHNQ